MAILVATAPLSADPYVAALRDAAPDVAVGSASEPHDPAAVEAILAWRLKPGEAARYPNLRVLCSIGAGVDKLLPPDLPPHVVVTRAVDPGQCEQIAQYVVAVTLQHTRELARYREQQARAHWERHRVRPAQHCRVGVLGLGAVGRAVVRAFLPLGYPVAGWARRPCEVAGAAVFAGEAGLLPLLGQTDVLVCALPLTPATHGLLGRATLSHLPPGAYLVSVGRGEQVVEADLCALLDTGRLAGAALDVFEREPLAAGSPLFGCPNLLLTPHIAGVTVESNLRVSMLVADKVAAALRELASRR
jgi:phosphoglycerate dehydrogenase-like enzyme